MLIFGIAWHLETNSLILFRGLKEPFSSTSEKIYDCRAFSNFETLPSSLIRSVDNQVIILWCAQAGKICRLKDQVNIRNRLTFLSKHLTDSYEVWKNLDFVINSVKNSDWRCRSGFGSPADLELRSKSISGNGPPPSQIWTPPTTTLSF